MLLFSSFLLTLKFLPLSLCIGIEFQITLTINQLIFKVIELFPSVLRETLQESLRRADGTVREEPADVGLASKSRLLLFRNPNVEGSLDILDSSGFVCIQIEVPFRFDCSFAGYD